MMIIIPGIGECFRPKEHKIHNGTAMCHYHSKLDYILVPNQTWGMRTRILTSASGLTYKFSFIPCGVANGPREYLSYETVILFVDGIIQRTITGSPPHETTIALPLKINLYSLLLKEYKLMVSYSLWSGSWTKQALQLSNKQ